MDNLQKGKQMTTAPKSEGPLTKRIKREVTDSEGEYDWNSDLTLHQSSNVVKEEDVKRENCEDTGNVNKNERHENRSKHNAKSGKIGRDKVLIGRGESRYLLGDSCEFECLICNKYETNSYGRLLKHYRTEHPKARAGIDAESAAKKMAFHNCRLCNRLLLHDKEFIIYHLRMRHYATWNFEDMIFEYVSIPERESPQPKELLPCKVRINRRSSTFVQAKVIEMWREEVSVVKPPLPKNSMPKESLYFEVTTYNYASLCKYQCPKCGLEITTWNLLYFHWLKCFNVKKVSLPTIAIKEARYHRCRVCNMVILCDLFHINHHIRSNHNKTISDYIKTTPSPERDLKFIQSGYKFNNAILDGFEKNQVDYSFVTDKYENLCEFACDKCGLQKSLWRAMSSHLSECKANMIFDPKYVIKFCFHDCRLCETRILCDKRFIRNHVRGSHPNSSKAYVSLTRKTSNNNIDTFENQRYNAKNAKSIPLVQPFQRPCNPANSLPEASTTAEVGNFCLFSCKSCDFRTDRWWSLRHHCIQNHNSPKSFPFNPSYVSEARYHRCQFCLTVILSELSFIKKHLRVVHSMTLECYRESKEKSLEDENNEVLLATEALRATVKIASKSLQKHKMKFILDNKILMSQQMTSKIENLCLFICQKCDFKAASWLILSRHYSTHHGNAVKGMQFAMTYVAEARYHQCKICMTGVLCDKVLIRRHVSFAHGIGSLEKYSKSKQKL